MFIFRWYIKIIIIFFLVKKCLQIIFEWKMKVPLYSYIKKSLSIYCSHIFIALFFEKRSNKTKERIIIRRKLKALEDFLGIKTQKYCNIICSYFCHALHLYLHLENKFYVCLSGGTWGRKTEQYTLLVTHYTLLYILGQVHKHKICSELQLK